MSGGFQQFVDRLISIVDREPDDWTVSDTLLLISLAPRAMRQPAIELLRISRETDGADLRAAVNMQIAGAIDWPALLNPKVASKWRLWGRAGCWQGSIEQEGAKALRQQLPR